MCALLADFFRGTLRLGERSTVALEEELALVRGYLAIEQVRFGSRLRAREEIAPECARCAAPPLILQPLVENAVKHGVSNLLEGGEIRIEAERRGAMVRIAVVNDFDPETPPGAGVGLGLENVRERLRARYREEARLETSRRDGRFRAEMWLPWEEAR